MTADSVAIRVCPMACVPDMAPSPKRLATDIGPADLLEYFHTPAAADQRQFGHGGNPGARCGLLGDRHGENEVGIVNRMRYRDTGRLEPVNGGRDVEVLRRADGELDRPGASHRGTRRSRPSRAPVAHGAKHPGEQRAKLRFER